MTVNAPVDFYIDLCLDCPFPDDCHPNSIRCPVYQQHKANLKAQEKFKPGRYMTTDQLVTLLSIDKEIIYRYIRKGNIPPGTVKSGRRWLWSKKHLSIYKTIFIGGKLKNGKM